ncbi:OmpH/Skp family outer membrane protein [Rickettsia endosymbiont of Oedothorax gibbosus]|uniref:OmpH family outer membrane protein n=1 Tax=Rickettsia endosymbiont of Oedothorax gibbosus TaxID=931099 RepID=UPI00202459A2|nr:OmpH family outer membrane protein [Rickettsia endosymbiont of Oedothorax gibbosus]
MKHYIWLTIISCLVINYGSTIYASDTNVGNRFDAKIAIVDVQSVLEHSAAIQSIRKAVEQIGKQIRQDLSKKDIELKKIDNLLMEKRNSVSESAFEQEVNAFNKKVNIAQKEIQDRKARLEQSHAEGIGKVQETIIKIINDLAEKHNLDLVIPNTQILFAKNTLNITQEVIAELNNQLKHVIIKYE